MTKKINYKAILEDLAKNAVYTTQLQIAKAGACLDILKNSLDVEILKAVADHHYEWDYLKGLEIEELNEHIEKIEAQEERDRKLAQSADPKTRLYAAEQGIELETLKNDSDAAVKAMALNKLEELADA